jgi:hypothetical protein
VLINTTSQKLLIQIILLKNNNLRIIWRQNSASKVLDGSLFKDFPK